MTRTDVAERPGPERPTPRGRPRRSPAAPDERKRSRGLAPVSASACSDAHRRLSPGVRPPRGPVVRPNLRPAPPPEAEGRARRMSSRAAPPPPRARLRSSAAAARRGTDYGLSGH